MIIFMNWQTLLIADWLWAKIFDWVVGMEVIVVRRVRTIHSKPFLKTHVVKLILLAVLTNQYPTINRAQTWISPKLQWHNVLLVWNQSAYQLLLLAQSTLKLKIQKYWNFAFLVKTPASSISNWQNETLWQLCNNLNAIVEKGEVETNTFKRLIDDRKVTE